MNHPVILAALVVFAAPALSAQDEEEYAQALATYEKYQARSPFIMHARGWDALARTKVRRFGRHGEVAVDPAEVLHVSPLGVASGRLRLPLPTVYEPHLRLTFKKRGEE